MDTSNTTLDGGVEPGTEGFAGHWQPAFRPDALEASPSQRPSDAIETDVPLFAQHDDDFSNAQQSETAPPPSILMPKAQPELPSDAIAKPVQRDKPPLHLFGESSDAYQRAEGTVSNTGIPSKSTQYSLRSPLIGLSWPTGHAGEDGAEMSSDEDNERLDPAWGIRRTDSTQILQNVNRSSSFPDFGAPSDKTPATQLSHSQVEQIMNERDNAISDPEDIDHDTREQSGGESLFQMLNESQRTGEIAEELQPVMENEDGQPTTEARYEEGVPLIPSESQPEDLAKTKEANMLSLGSAVHAPTAEAEPSFFDHLSTTSQGQAVVPPHLDRKTTSDVYESLNFSPDGSLDSPVREAPFDQMENDEAEEFDFSQLKPDENAQEDADAMWKAALADDEFLVEDPDDLLPESPPDSPSSFLDSLRDDPTPNHPVLQTSTPNRDSRPEFARQSSSNPYAPHQPSTSDLTQLSPTTYANVGLTRPGLAPMNSFQQHLQQRPAPPQTAQSFVDQSKTGYKSPYDLPLELSKPRKRVQAPLPSPALKSAPPPPPRSSSMSSDKQLQSPFTPTNTSFPNLARGPPAQAPTAPTPRSTSITSPPQPAPKARTSSSNFFEELPVSSRPRPATGQGRYTPQQNTSMPPPQLLPRSPPSRQGSQSQAQASPPRSVADPYAQYQLRPPERLDPYANVPLQAPAAPVVPGVSSTRYSPAPVASQLGPKPIPSARYSPAPPSQPTGVAPPNRYASQPVQSIEPPAGAVPAPSRYTSQPAMNPPSSTVQPFQPRTSSPLAYHGRTINEPPRTVPSTTERNASISYFPDNTSSFRSQGQPIPSVPVSRPGIPAASPPRAGFLPPIRSQTQSPGKRGPPTAFPTLSDDSLNRPASVHSQIPQPNNFPLLESFPPQRPNVRPRGLTQTFDFIEPSDGQQQDELQRWRGAPIFRFGFGGSIVSSFPKHIPRYGAGMSAPMIKPSVGEVILRNAKDILPSSDLTTTFPGPLRSKSKKKEVLSWLTSYIASLENAQVVRVVSRQLPNPQKRHDEKILLWKIVQALVEHDGVLEIGAEPRKAVNNILTPEIFALDESTATQYRDGTDTNGIYRPAGAIVRSDPVDPVAVENLRISLLRGEREKAVWGAVDNRLWAHALLISSTLDRTVWKQIVQEFVRQEVKTIGANTESLAAVYEVFAGNMDESIDELVPPSARAGLQMVSKVDSAGPTKNALDGLDRWRETLSLVLNNRSPDDVQAIASLGRLLASYGRVEAAHICFIFCRGPTLPNIFGGVDDPLANVVLLGADHQGQPSTFHQDHDAVLLTEVYEFATTILGNGALSSGLPHLQVYKLNRASSLAELGRKTDAQAYCEGITGSLKSNTKMSPYFHPIFFSELDELSNRLKQAPVQSSSSWIAKPSIEKVSGSVWNKFSSFVAGDDSDAESKGSGKDANHELGPFGKVTGTPSLSRSGSQTDLYGSYPANPAPTLPNTIAGSRYAPNGLQTARSSSELTRGRASLDSQRSPPATSMGQGQRSGSFEPASSYGQQGHLPQTNHLYQSLSQSPPTSRYHATPPQTSYMPSSTFQESPQSNFSARQQEAYIPTPPPEQVQKSYVPTPPPTAEPMPLPIEHPSFGGYSPAMPAEEAAVSDQPEPSYNTSYEPPADSYGYEPPADTGYVPYQPEPDSDPESDARPKLPKKKSIMDDDDDDFPRVSNGTSTGPPPPSSKNQPVPGDDAAARKRANDAAADAAFRAAAEADAARAKEKEKDKSGSLKGKPSSWGLGGWFGGKKSDSLDASPSASKGGDPKVHRAHLGESKMTLHYDKELKKWVDPSNPDSMKEKSATPPPPRMGPGPRALTPSASMPAFPSGTGSGSAGPPSGPPSRVGTPGDASGTTPPPSGLPPNMLQRPGSSGLSGPPSGAGTPPPGSLAPPSRPATGMSNASSIDDLLGPPSGASGGRRTVKGKKGAKRYIDVMAQ